MERSQPASGSETRSWTEEEDQKLIKSKLAGLNRKGKSCRERWKNHLDPNVKRENFSQVEDDSIICFQSLYGNSLRSFCVVLQLGSIAAHLPGRTDNDVKNRWYNHLNEKKLGRSTGDQPHTTQLFHLNHNIDPNASSSSSSIPTLVSASQEIASPWPTSELASLESEFMSTEEVIRYFSD
ncbi:transcription factor MYB15-like [Vitis riparia]|uniref:transcription factor MYB15-like n=1 Tax=Vitis riparia TaxID=96939 RepID=UPI00155ACD50|nr:transcription factor MYB15-like [Vitis riparia]